MTDAPPPRGPRSIGRSVGRAVGLGAVAFVATFLLLFGLVNVIRRTDGGGVATIVPTAAAPAATSQATGAGGPAASASPSGSPSVAGDPVLVGAGDIADCALDSDDATAALLDGIAGSVFTAGDNAYTTGSPDQFRDCYAPTWGRQLERTRPAPGNHDWETKDAAGYLGYFGSRAAPDGTSWYAYDLGSWHVIVLDSDCTFVGGCGPDTVQGRWLASDLATSTARCTLAIWHHPRFSSGEHGNDVAVAPFWQALYDAGADVVINGHDHDYERFAPQDPSGKEDRIRGLREFVVGTGGAGLRDFTTQAANSELRAAVSHGVIRLVLQPSSYEWSFIPTKPGFTDAGSGPCH